MSTSRHAGHNRLPGHDRRPAALPRPHSPEQPGMTPASATTSYFDLHTRRTRKARKPRNSLTVAFSSREFSEPTCASATRGKFAIGGF